MDTYREHFAVTLLAIHNISLHKLIDTQLWQRGTVFVEILYFFNFNMLCSQYPAHLFAYIYILFVLFTIHSMLPKCFENAIYLYVEQQFVQTFQKAAQHEILIPVHFKNHFIYCFSGIRIMR